MGVSAGGGAMLVCGLFVFSIYCALAAALLLSMYTPVFAFG